MMINAEATDENNLGRRLEEIFKTPRRTCGVREGRSQYRIQLGG